MFGKKTIEVLIDGVVEVMSVGDIIQIIRERNAAREQRNKAMGDRDELEYERDVIQHALRERLDAANAKLKDYGHLGEF